MAIFSIKSALKINSGADFFIRTVEENTQKMA